MQIKQSIRSLIVNTNEPKVPRQVKSRMVKQSILDATTNLVKTHGYEYVTVSNVCRAAGVSVGSFYHHFENKDDLFAYYLRVSFESNPEYVANITEKDIVSAVVACYAIYIDFIVEQGVEFTKNYYTPINKSLGSHNISSSNRHEKLPIMTKAIELISKGKASGYIREATQPEQLGEDLCVTTKGIIFDWAASNGTYDLKDTYQRILTAQLFAYMTDKYLNEFPETYARD